MALSIDRLREPAGERPVRRPETREVTSLMGMPLVVASARMRSVMELVKRIAQSNAAVLITGDSGSGKELIARAVHYYSGRSCRPWVDVNCAALPDHLMESELFGYEKGAFSGAESQKPGMFELANNGTLFLDEIGELDLRMQVKLLRVLDGTPYYRLGGTRKISADVRIVAATNIDLREAVEQGKFRRDLYHRLDQLRLEVPPLRERLDDVEPLACHFLAKESPHLKFTADAIRVLETYSWPGNVRELRNIVVKAALNADGAEILASDLPIAAPGRDARGVSKPRTLDEIERHAILSALMETEGRQDRAARILGISQRTLIRKLKIYQNQNLSRRDELQYAGEVDGCDGLEEDIYPPSDLGENAEPVLVEAARPAHPAIGIAVAS